MFTCCLALAHLAVLNRLYKIQNGNYRDRFHTKMMAFGANSISNLALHEHILFNVVLNVGMQSTQVGGACDDDIPEQFSSNLYKPYNRQIDRTLLTAAEACE